MTQQSDRQASVRFSTGATGAYEGDWHALFDQAGIPAGDHDGRMLAWINLVLGKTYTSLPEAQQAFAAQAGAMNWSSLGSFNTAPSGKAFLTLSSSVLTLSGNNPLVL